MKQLTVIVLALMLGACSSINPLNKNINKGENIKDVKLRGGSEAPTWFFEYPKDTDSDVYSVATGQSADFQFAIDIAIHDAKVMMADKLQNYMNADMKRFIEESGTVVSGNTTQMTTKMSQSIINELDMGGYVIEKKIVVNEGPHFRAFVLMTFDKSNWYPTPKVETIDQDKIDQAFTDAQSIQ